MSLQSERILLLMHRLGLTERVHGYQALSEQAAQRTCRTAIFWSKY